MPERERMHQSEGDVTPKGERMQQSEGERMQQPEGDKMPKGERVRISEGDHKESPKATILQTMCKPEPHRL
eukprot:3140169-Ditylum_brightwellii.AAC.1